MPDNTAKIAAIDKKIQAGVTRIDVDNIVTQIDLEALRTERRRLEQTNSVNPKKRRSSRRIDLSGG